MNSAIVIMQHLGILVLICLTYVAISRAVANPFAGTSGNAKSYLTHARRGRLAKKAARTINDE